MSRYKKRNQNKQIRADYGGYIEKEGKDQVLKIAKNDKSLFNLSSSKIKGIYIEDCLNLTEISDIHSSVDQLYFFNLPKLIKFNMKNIYNNLTCIVLYKVLIKKKFIQTILNHPNLIYLELNTITKATPLKLKDSSCKKAEKEDEESKQTMEINIYKTPYTLSDLILHDISPEICLNICDAFSINLKTIEVINCSLAKIPKSIECFKFNKIIFQNCGFVKEELERLEIKSKYLFLN